MSFRLALQCYCPSHADSCDASSHAAAAASCTESMLGNIHLLNTFNDVYTSHCALTACFLSLSNPQICQEYDTTPHLQGHSSWTTLLQLHSEVCLSSEDLHSYRLVTYVMFYTGTHRATLILLRGLFWEFNSLRDS